MCTVVIADDEPRICDLVKYLIHWEELGLSLVGCVNDGQDLLDLIRREHPDIVITDVVMPQAGGLEIVRKVQEQGFSCHFVIISGHRYFDFVRDALKYGVCDYLLKPIDEDELNTTLKKICGQIADQLREDQATAARSREMEQTRESLAQHLIVNSFGHTETFGDLAQVNHDYCVSFQPGAFWAMILAIEQKEEEGGAVVQLAVRAASEGVERACEQAGAYAVCRPLGQRICVLLNFGTAPSSPGKLAEDLLDAARRQLDAFPGFSATLGYGSVENQISGFPGSLRAAERAVEERICLGRGRAIGPEQVPAVDYETDAAAILSREEVQQLVYVFDGLNGEKYASWVKNVCDVRPGPRPGCFWYAMSERIGEIFQEAVQTDSEEGMSGKDLTTEMTDQLERAPRDGLMEALITPVQARLKAIREEKDAQINRPIQMAKEYINAHYMEPIRLEDVAQHVFLHPAYLSHIFKDVVGIGFSEYLANCRLERAKYLLTHSNDTIYAVARQCGYTEPRAFSKFFLKNIGVKPSDYRRMYS